MSAFHAGSGIATPKMVPREPAFPLRVPDVPTLIAVQNLHQRRLPTVKALRRSAHHGAQADDDVVAMLVAAFAHPAPAGADDDNGIADGMPGNGSFNPLVAGLTRDRDREGTINRGV